MAPLFRLLRTIAHYTLTPLLALLLAFEEWGWEPLSRLFARLARLPLWARLETFISTLPPYAALLVFLVPVVTLVPIKLLAWYWISHGHALLGCSLVVAAKIVGTAVAARLFQLTHPTLMRLPWFNRVYGRWKTWKDGLLAQLRASFAWRASRALARRAKMRAQRGWRVVRAAFSAR